MSWNLDSSSLKLGFWVPDPASWQIFFCHLTLPWLFASASSLKEQGTEPSRAPQTKRYLKRKRSASNRNSEFQPPGPHVTMGSQSKEERSRSTYTVSRSPGELCPPAASIPGAGWKQLQAFALPRCWPGTTKQHSLKGLKEKEKGKRNGGRRKISPRYRKSFRLLKLEKAHSFLPDSCS